MLRRADEKTTTANVDRSLRMNFESVLIVTYGRSGSTLLQGVLNSIPGCLVRGENNNFCYCFFQGYQALLAAKRERETSSPTSPWFGSEMLDADSYLQDVAALVRRQLLADTDPATVSCLGFKEVRYPGVVDLPLYLDFLEQIFPNTAFLFLTRDLGSVAKSAWWKAGDAGKVQAKLDRFEKSVRQWAGSRRNFFHLDYRDLADQGPRMGDLFAFLGAPYDVAAVGAVIATRHSTPGIDRGKTAKRARSDAGRAAASLAGVAKDNVAPAPAPAPVQWQVVGRPATRIMFFDPLLKTAPDPAVVNLSGVLLPAVELPANLRLVFRQAAGEVREVDWGLPSPATASRFPGDERAGTARFSLPLPLAASGGDLVLESADGDAWIIAKIGVNT